MVEVAGRPLLTWSFDVLWAAGCRPVFVVVDEDRSADARRALRDRGEVVSPAHDHRSTKLSLLTDRVATEHVVVHEYARPFATVEQVHAAVDALESADCAVTAVPVKETLKRVEKGSITGTIDRSNLSHMQTPQAFRTEALIAAYLRAEEQGWEDVDDVQAVELWGGKLVLVPGSPKNVKTAAFDDLRLAEAIARSIE